MKAPWGRNGVSEDGVRLDEHVQPGTGSTDLFGGASVQIPVLRNLYGDQTEYAVFSAGLTVLF